MVAVLWLVAVICAGLCGNACGTLREIRVTVLRGRSFPIAAVDTVHRPSRVTCYAACLERDACVSVNALCDGDGGGDGACTCELLSDVYDPDDASESLNVGGADTSYLRPAARVVRYPSTDGGTYVESHVSASAPVTHVLVAVKGCMDAFLCLSEGPLATGNAYEIVIGKSANQWSVIRPQRNDYSEETARQVLTDQFLNCTEYRRFWLSWDEAAVRVGRGWAVGRDLFMERQETPAAFHQVQYLAAGGYGSEAVHFIFV